MFISLIAGTVHSHKGLAQQNCHSPDVRRVHARTLSSAVGMERAKRREWRSCKVQGTKSIPPSLCLM